MYVGAYVLFLFKDCIYLFMRDTQRHRQREKQAPHREPHVGLDPRTGSHAVSGRQTLKVSQGHMFFLREVGHGIKKSLKDQCSRQCFFEHFGRFSGRIAHQS